MADELGVDVADAGGLGRDADAAHARSVQVPEPDTQQFHGTGQLADQRVLLLQRGQQLFDLVVLSLKLRAQTSRLIFVFRGHHIGSLCSLSLTPTST